MVEQKTSNELAGERTGLAVDRTVMAANRTLMAWVRTGLSMISFGFTIYKFLQAAVKVETVEHVMLRAQSPRRFGLFLIALGVVSVVLGAVEYFATVKRLNTMSERIYSPCNFSFIMALAIGLLGLFLFTTILIHAEVF